MDIKPTDVKPAVGEQTTWPFPVEIQEQLAIDQGKSVKNVWALKLPRFLLERWERVPEAGVELGTLVVDSSYTSLLAPFHQADLAGQIPLRSTYAYRQKHQLKTHQNLRIKQGLHVPPRGESTTHEVFRTNTKFRSPMIEQRIRSCFKRRNGIGR